MTPDIRFAVDHIDLRALPGEVTALVGPNVAGKTTLLLMLATMLAPGRGPQSCQGATRIA